MVEIGGYPILWHIMKLYSAHGVRSFIICLGYRGYQIKEYFANYLMHVSDVTFDLSANKVTIHKNRSERWNVTLVDTGQDTMTGGRLKRIGHLVRGTFCMTYGDGLSNIDVSKTIECHRRQGNLATVSAVRPPGRFGSLKIRAGKAAIFHEKPAGDGAWVNGGFFVLEPDALNRIDGDSTVWERQPLEGLAREGQLGVYEHEGFWQPMDTLRDKQYLEELWAAGDAPWKVW